MSTLTERRPAVAGTLLFAWPAASWAATPTDWGPVSYIRGCARLRKPIRPHEIAQRRLTRRPRIRGAVLGYICSTLVCILAATAAEAAPQGAMRSVEVRQLVERIRQQPPLQNQPVTLILEADSASAFEGKLKAHGGQLRYRHGRLHEVLVPGGRIGALLDDLPAGLLARFPYPHHALAVTGQGVGITGAADMHALGQRGANVPIGIIDLGFSSLAAAQAKGDLPAGAVVLDYSGTGATTGTSHGTSVAEIAHEMAPDAPIYLAKIASEVQLAQAASDLAAAGVKVINHSVAWFGAAFYDGTGTLCDTVDTATDAGMQWVNAMGNYRNKHYLGTFTDTNGDLRHEYAVNQNYNVIALTANSAVLLVLNWDAYPSTTVDYNLYLYNGNPDSGGSIVASSTNAQSGKGPAWYPYPYESINYTPTATGNHYIVVKKATAATTNLRFTLFSTGPDLTTRTLASSLAQPADCANSLAVGATDLNDAPESFSSEGPTVDNRAKPEISAPNRVQTSLSSQFAGTSAAAPHIAGAVSLLKSQYPGHSPAMIRSLLMGTAEEVLPTGYDYRTGYGRLSLDADGDGINHDADNCPLVANADQADFDLDAWGDACDSDIDNDNLSNAAETSLGTDAYDPDSDNDGLADGAEVNTYGTNPVLADTDGDGLNDGDEINTYGTNPLASDKGDLAPATGADGRVNLADLLVLTRFVEGLAAPAAKDLVLGDMNDDGVLDVRDILLLRRQLGI